MLFLIVAQTVEVGLPYSTALASFWECVFSVGIDQRLNDKYVNTRDDVI